MKNRGNKTCKRKGSIAIGGRYTDAFFDSDNEYAVTDAVMIRKTSEERLAGRQLLVDIVSSGKTRQLRIVYTK